MTFEEYLISKKIEVAPFRLQQPAEYEAWEREFAQMHPNSFTAQKLFLINRIRRTFRLKETEITPPPPSAPAAPVAKPKPIMRPKMN